MTFVNICHVYWRAEREAADVINIAQLTVWDCLGVGLVNFLSKYGGISNIII